MKDPIFKIFLLLPLVTLPATAADTPSLSTSTIFGVYDGEKSAIPTFPCSGKKATFASSYVSMSVRKFMVNKSDSAFTRMINLNRQAFPAATFSADYNGQTINVAKVGKPTALSGGESSVDLGTEWTLFNKIPWVLKSAKMELRIGYSAKSTSDEIANAFSSITSAIPNYTLSTSAAAGIAIAGTVDKLLFAPDRTTEILRANRDLPLTSNQLCAGPYVIFSAKNSSAYDKYYNQIEQLVWTGVDLQFNKKPIKDVSYVVLSVSVDDRYYSLPKDSINDGSRLWAKKYATVTSKLIGITYASTIAEIDAIDKDVRSGFIEAHTLLDADSDLISSEKNDIHSYVLGEAAKSIASGRSRLSENNTITKESTQIAIESSFNNTSPLITKTERINLGEILKNPETNIIEVEKGVPEKLKSTLSNIEKSIGAKFN